MSVHDVDARLLGTGMSFEFSGPWTGYWLAFLRVLTGYWLFHAGLTKILEGGFSANGWLTGAAGGTVVGPITTWFAANAAWFVNLAIPWGEFLIGLGLMLGVLTRLAAFWGMFLMTFFVLGNAGWAHGMVNGDLMGLLLFGTAIVFGTGRYLGLDAYIEELEFVKRRPALKYLLG